MTLMQRRRALMALIEGGANMIPGKIVTVTTEITKGDQVASFFNNLTDKPTGPGVYIINKKKSSWATNQLVYVVLDKNGNLGTDGAYKWKYPNIVANPSTSTYDFVAAVGTEYMLVEVPTT